MKTYHILLSHEAKQQINQFKTEVFKMQINVTNLQDGSLIYTGDCEDFLYSFLDSDIEYEIKLDSFCCSQTQCIIISTDEADYLIEKVLELIY